MPRIFPTARTDTIVGPAFSVDPGDRYRAVVAGYGTVGQTVVRLRAENAIHSTVIEISHRTVRRLKQQGVSVVHGDAGRRETLLGAARF
jgi:CPA2 family monovalent cation:H+ antiporter-2